MSANTESKMGSSARSAGTRNARLRHQRQQSDGLQRHGFSAGVGAADDELAVLGVELNSKRNDGNAPRLQRPLQQRMPRVAQHERITRGCVR